MLIDKERGTYTMKQQHIERINELARKAKTDEGLTPEELEERKTLRQAYINEFRQSLQIQLDNTYIVDHKGNKTIYQTNITIIKFSISKSCNIILLLILFYFLLILFYFLLILFYFLLLFFLNYFNSSYLIILNFN